MEVPFTGEKIQKLILNEVFVAEEDVGKTSIYKLIVDNKDMGKFKSSGVIVSTGTGSSGWLFSARRIT
jgi:NAD+ kinase